MFVEGNIAIGSIEAEKKFEKETEKASNYHIFTIIFDNQSTHFTRRPRVLCYSHVYESESDVVTRVSPHPLVGLQSRF